jgi:hypothetical protein
MNEFQEKYVGIIYSAKALYYISKIAGLAPFCFTVSSDEGVNINTSIHSNIVSVAWTLLILSMLLGGSVCYFSAMVSSGDTSAHYITFFVVSVPLSILMALLAICMNLTVNRRKFCELCKKLNDIDRALFKYGVSERNIWFNIQMVVLLLVVVPWLCVDGWLWRERMSVTGEATARLSHLIQLLVVIQFCKLTQFVRQSLNTLNKALSINIEYEYERCNIISKEFTNDRFSDANSVNIIPITERLSRTQHLTSIEQVSQHKVTSVKSVKVCNLLEIRRIYGKIYEIVGCINSIYGFSVLLELVRNVLSVIVNVLHILQILNVSTVYGHPFYLFIFLQTFWILFFISREMAITVSCHMTTSEAKKIQDNVQCILLRQHVRTEILEQLKMFSTQLTVNRIEFTAFGFFTLNLSTLSTFIASVITYIVVLEQMK